MHATAPTKSEYIPSAQSVQKSAPIPLCFPTAQLVQLVEKSAKLNWPPAHGVQDGADSLLYCPL